MTEHVEQRFWSHVDLSGDCWEWTASKTPRGYGQFWITPTERTYAHRFALTLAKGPPPFSDAYALHSCDRPSCVRPEHLRWGTQQDNMDDMMARKTECIRGHDLTDPTNVRISTNWNGRPFRRCRACDRGYAAARRARAKTERTAQ